MRIFVSYRAENRDLVEELVADLQDMEHTVWYDQQLKGGQMWWDSILENIRSCDVYVPALTPQFVSSRACQAECNYALSLRRHVLPLLLDEGVTVELLPETLQQHQVINYMRRDKTSFKALLAGLRILPPTEPLPEPLPPAPPPPISPLAAINEQIEQTALTYEEQTAIVHRLKSHLADEEYAIQARSLLERLSQHPSLLASVLTDIQPIIYGRPLDTRPPTGPPHRDAAEEPRQETGSEASITLDQGEQLRGEFKIAHLRGAIKGHASGTLSITDRRLIFQAAMFPVTISRRRIEIDLGDIVSVERSKSMVTGSTLVVTTKSGDNEEFLVVKNRSSLNLLPLRAVNAGPDEAIKLIRSLL